MTTLHKYTHNTSLKDFQDFKFSLKTGILTSWLLNPQGPIPITASSFCMYKVLAGTILMALDSHKQELYLYDIKTSRTCFWIFRLEAPTMAYSFLFFRFFFFLNCLLTYQACFCETRELRASSRFFVKFTLWMTLEV